MTAGTRPDDPRDYHPDELVHRFIGHRSIDATDRTIRSYESRLERFLEWCETEDVTRMGDLTRLLVDDYGMHVRSKDLAPTTVKDILATHGVFLEDAEELRGGDEGRREDVRVPPPDVRQEKLYLLIAVIFVVALVAVYLLVRPMLG